MDWGSLFLAALFGAIGGGLGGAAGAYVEKSWKGRFRGILGVLGVIFGVVISNLVSEGFGAATTPAKNEILESWQTIQTREQFDSFVVNSNDPIAGTFQELFENDRETYVVMRDQVVSLVRSGKSESAIANEMRGAISNYAATRVQTLSDFELAEFLRQLVVQGEELRAVSPKICVGLFLDEPVGSLYDTVTPRFVEADRKMMKILSSSMQVGGGVASDQTMAEVLPIVLAPIEEKYGYQAEKYLSVTSSIGLGRDELFGVCDAYVLFFQALNKLPSERQAQVFRRMAVM